MKQLVRNSDVLVQKRRETKISHLREVDKICSQCVIWFMLVLRNAFSLHKKRTSTLNGKNERKNMNLQKFQMWA